MKKYIKDIKKFQMLAKLEILNWQKGYYVKKLNYSYIKILNKQQ